MKIRLIEPKSTSNNVYDHTRLPRLGLPILGAVLAEDGHDVAIYVESLAPAPWDDLMQADLIGFSTTTGTTPPAYALADKLRAAGKTVVFGGAHVTFLPEEALEHADYVIRGEGHTAILELVEALDATSPTVRAMLLASIAGLSYNGPEGPVHNPERPFCSEATYGSLPRPALSLIEGHENMHTTPVMTQWGCPFDCTFCSVIKMFGRKVRARPVEDVLTELGDIPTGREVFFYDDNLVVDKRRTKALLSGMIERGLYTPWSGQMRAEAVFNNDGTWDTELLELMRDSHCNWVYIGFESVNPDALKEMNKHQTVEQIAESVRAFHAYGIRVHGMFVLGVDSDTVETVRATARWAIHHKIDTAQFLTITPLPGTDFAAEMQAEGRILSDDWSLYDGHHAVIKPANMTPYRLQMETFRAMLRFYAPRRAWRMLIANIFRELPFLLRLFLKERKLWLTLPKVAVLSVRPEKVSQILDTFQQALGPQTWWRLRDVFIVPLFRRYAYVHTRRGLRQPQNRHYIAWLRALTSPRRRAEEMS